MFKLLNLCKLGAPLTRQQGTIMPSANSVKKFPNTKSKRNTAAFLLLFMFGGSGTNRLYINIASCVAPVAAACGFHLTVVGKF